MRNKMDFNLFNKTCLQYTKIEFRWGGDTSFGHTTFLAIRHGHTIISANFKKKQTLTLYYANR